MRYLDAFLWYYKALALSLSSPICWRMILNIQNLLLLTFGSIWIVLFRKRHQLSQVCAVILQKFGFVGHVLECNWARWYVYGLSSRSIHNLSSATCLAAISLTWMVRLLYRAVGSGVLFWDLIQNSSNWALSGVIFLLSSTLVNLSYWWGTFTFRVRQHMRGDVWVLWCWKLLEYLLWLFWTSYSLLGSEYSLGLFCLKLGSLLLLHQKLLILKTLPYLRILDCWADLIGLLMGRVNFGWFKAMCFLNLSRLKLVYSFDRAIWQTKATNIIVQILRTLLPCTWGRLTFLSLSLWGCGCDLHLHISILRCFKICCRCLGSI